MNIPFSAENERLNSEQLSVAPDRLNTTGQAVMNLWQAVGSLFADTLQAVTPNTSSTQANIVVREHLAEPKTDPKAIANTAIDAAARREQAELTERELRAAAARQAAEDARGMQV